VAIWIWAPEADLADDPFDMTLVLGTAIGATAANCVELTRGGPPGKDGSSIMTGDGAERLFWTMASAIGGGDGMRGGAYPVGCRGGGAMGMLNAAAGILFIV